ncbi:MAG: LPS export ABC transporter periplasmic protein LptC [Deltaproteobacteria bacterium]|nr:LPS export ABC transporter periplasmic protein LptC [Deltaproteobacteria bacterium]
MTPPAPASGEPLPEGQVRLTDVVMDRFERDHLRERAQVESMTLARSARAARGKGVEVEVRAKAPDAGPTRLFAPMGAVDMRTQRTFLTGGVRVVDAAGRTLTTEALTHEGAENVVRSEHPVTLEGENFRIQGAGFVLRPDADDLQVAGPIQAELSEAPAAPGGR